MSNKVFMKRAAFVGVTLLTVWASAGCGYSSLYVSPPDGRARTVWREDNVVVDLASGPATDSCLSQVGAVTRSSRLYLLNQTLELASVAAPYQVGPLDDYWVPVFYGPPIVVSSAVNHRPAVTFTRVAATGTTIAPPPNRTGKSSSSTHGESSASRAFTAAAIVALVILPVVDLVLAINRPESATRSAHAIDQVHAYNDFVRTPGSPCVPTL